MSRNGEWNEFDSLIEKMGGEANYERVSTADDVYKCVISLGEYEYGCGFYKAVTLFLSDREFLAKLARNHNRDESINMVKEYLGKQNEKLLA